MGHSLASDSNLISFGKEAKHDADVNGVFLTRGGPFIPCSL